jgi:hypothetical protein
MDYTKKNTLYEQTKESFKKCKSSFEPLSSTPSFNAQSAYFDINVMHSTKKKY